eukprot:scaffold368_cov258-Pinguiococcus_pyrenoidosus.AAC.11
MRVLLSRTYPRHFRLSPPESCTFRRREQRVRQSQQDHWSSARAAPQERPTAQVPEGSRLRTIVAGLLPHPAWPRGRSRTRRRKREYGPPRPTKDFSRLDLLMFLATRRSCRHRHRLYWPRSWPCGRPSGGSRNCARAAARWRRR